MMDIYQKAFLIVAAIFFFTLSAMASSKGASAEDLIDPALCTAESVGQFKADQAEAPQNSDTLFKLGQCYLHMGYLAQAHSTLAAAVRFDPGKAKSVARFYLTAAASAMRRDDIRQSQVFFQKAIQSDPGVRPAAAQEAFRQGKRLFDAGKPEAADARFSVANALDESYGRRIGNLYFERGNALHGTQCLEFYRLAAWYSRLHNEAIGLRLLRLAKRSPSNEMRETLKSEAGRYLSRETIEVVFPSPSWKTVQSQSFIGRGVGRRNQPKYHLPTVRFGQPVKPGDRLIVEADGRFKVWDAGWEEHRSRCEIIVRSVIDGDYFYVQGPKNRLIVVTVQRYE